MSFATGPATRAAATGKRFGDQAYAMEELVAELGAAFVCADLQITDDPRATASGRGASVGSWDRSSAQAKNRTNGRRFRVM